MTTGSPMKKNHHNILDNLKRIFIFLCIGALFSTVSNANILIVNSDQNNFHYQKNLLSFKEGITTTINIVHLDDKDDKWTLDITDSSLIYGIGKKASQVIQKTTLDHIPIIISEVKEQAIGSVKPITITTEISSKTQLLMITQFFPSLRSLGILYSPRHHRAWVNQAMDHAYTSGIRLNAIPVKQQLTPVLMEKVLHNSDALWLIQDPMVLNNTESIQLLFKKATELGIPVITTSDQESQLGSILTITNDPYITGQQAAHLAKQLLSGHIPSNTRITPIGSHITLNLSEITTSRIPLNPLALKNANTLIQ